MKHSKKTLLVIASLCILSLSCLTGQGFASGESYTREFQWSFKGTTWEWVFNIPKSAYDVYDKVPVTDRTHHGWSFLVTTGDGFVQDVARALHTVAQEQGFSLAEEVGFALAFVQSLPYTSDNVTTGYDDFPRFPVETLVDGGGDCEDTAILFASLVLCMDYGAIFINPPRHLAVGVAGDFQMSGSGYYLQGTFYYYCETTGEGWGVGQLPSEYHGITAGLIAIDESRQYVPGTGEEAEENDTPPDLINIALIVTLTACVAILILAKKHRQRQQDAKVKDRIAPAPVPVPVPVPGQDHGTPSKKPTHVMELLDVVEVQRAWNLYKTTGRALRFEECKGLAPLCEKYPYLFTRNSSSTGVLPTMTLFTMARVLADYARAGQLPDAIETPAGIISLEGGA